MYDCTYDFNVNGKCVSLTGISQNFTYAAGDFGTSCKIWWDPTAACMDITQYPPDWKPLSEQADWCQRPWCYVDPCNCDVADAQRVTTSLVRFSTAMPHAAKRIPLLESPVQPTPWGMPNARRRQQSQLAMPILSRWAVAC